MRERRMGGRELLLNRRCVIDGGRAAKWCLIGCVVGPASSIATSTFATLTTPTSLFFNATVTLDRYANELASVPGSNLQG